MSKVGAVAILFFFLSPQTYSQNSFALSHPDSGSIHPPSSVVKPTRWYTMLENIPGNWGRWAEISFRKDKIGEWTWIGALTVITFVTDDDSYTPSERFYHSSGAATYWSDFFAAFGDGRTQFGLAGAYAAYGLVFSDEKAFRTGSQIVQAVLASGAVIQVLKHVTGRESPFVRSTPTGRWSFFPNQVDYHRFVPYFDAFPSGHICTSLATVIVISENYPDVKWIRPVGYVLTGLVGIGMANNGIHWYSDYPLGLFLGYYFGMIAAHPEGFDISPHNEGSSSRLFLMPRVGPSGTGLNFALTF